MNGRDQAGELQAQIAIAQEKAFEFIWALVDDVVLLNREVNDLRARLERLERHAVTKQFAREAVK